MKIRLPHERGVRACEWHSFTILTAFGPLLNSAFMPLERLSWSTLDERYTKADEVSLGEEQDGRHGSESLDPTPHYNYAAILCSSQDE